MAEGRDFSRLGLAAAAACPGLFTLCRTGRRCRYRPLAKVMAECVYIGINIAVTAARAGVRRVSLCRTRRCRHCCNIVVAEGRNFSRLCLTAAAARPGLFTLCRAGRRRRYRPLAKVMAKCRNDYCLAFAVFCVVQTVSCRHRCRVDRLSSFLARCSRRYRRYRHIDRLCMRRIVLAPVVSCCSRITSRIASCPCKVHKLPIMSMRCYRLGICVGLTVKCRGCRVDNALGSCLAGDNSINDLLITALCADKCCGCRSVSAVIISGP